jgi:hypothetical protein
MIWQRFRKPQPAVTVLRKIVNADAGRESYRKGTIAKANQPKGMTPLQIRWARRHRGNKEAEMIMGFAAEGPLVLKW